MPDIKIPFGFETQVSTDTDPDNWRDIKGYQAQVSLNHVVVYSKYYRSRDQVMLAWQTKHPRPATNDGGDVVAQWMGERGRALKDTVEDDKDAADQVLTDFANRLALTLTWPDGA
jgi:hypothetical protein